MTALFALVLALFALERLRELAVSRCHIARAAPGSPAADSPSAWAAMVALNAALIALPALEALLRGRAASAPLLAVALALLVFAQLLRVWAMSSLGRAWNARGLVDPHTRVVASGPYALVRHPNYLAVLIELLALPLAGAAWIALLLVLPSGILLLARRMAREEALLSELPGYAEAMAGKGRLLPRASTLRALLARRWPGS